MQQYGSKYFARSHPTPSPRHWDKNVKLTFAEHGHVAYQIKGNRECSNMVTNILLDVRPLPPNPGGQKVEIQLP